MRSHTIHEQGDLAAPAATVWAVLADYSRDPHWRRGVRSMTPSPSGPVEVGTTALEVIRFAGTTRHIEGVVTEVDPGRRFAWRATSGATISGMRTIEPSSDHRCRVHLELTLTPSGVERLIAPLLTAMLRRNLAGDIVRLGAEVAAQETLPGPRSD
ncbi:MAG: SRPBCC family protein [Acidimicrobiales bacterium]